MIWPPQPLPEDDDDPQTDAELWRARYLAAHEVLVLVEEHIERVEDWATPAASRGPAASALPSYRAMRDAFFAYRQSIEAGGPLVWQVAGAVPALAPADDDYPEDYRSAEHGCS